MTSLVGMAVEVAEIATERLRLVPIAVDVARALVAGDVAGAERRLGARFPAGYLNERERAFLSRQADRLEAVPQRGQWMARWLVLEATGECVGHAGFHGPPEHNGRAEIGYSVFEPYRRRGYATEACRALTEWAFEQGESSVFLSIRPDNTPSLAIARRLGYVEVGSQDDPEDGLELVFERRSK